MTTRKANLTQAVADAAKKGEIIRDENIRGFYLKVHETGKKSWMYAFRLKDGQRRHPFLGRFPQLTAAEARKKAGDFQNIRNNGGDPTQQVRTLRESPTVEEIFWPEKVPDSGLSFRHSYVARRCGPATRNWLIAWRYYIKPHFAKRRVCDITKADLIRVAEILRPRGKTVPAVFAMRMSAFLDWCEIKGLRPKGSNPTRTARREGELDQMPVIVRRHPLTEAQFQRLNEEIDRWERDHPDRFQAAALRLLIITGLRCEEIAKVERPWIDLPSGVINLPRTKSGRHAKGTTGARTVHLSEDAVAMIRDIYAKRPDSKFLIPGARNQIERRRRDGRIYRRGGDYSDHHLTNPWATIRKRAGLPKLNIHSMRHYVAAQLLAAGVPLPDVSKMFGHKDVRITAQVYARELAEPHPEIVAKSQSFMAELMRRKAGVVVALPKVA